MTDRTRRYGCEVQQCDRRWGVALKGEIDAPAAERLDAVLRLVEPLSDVLSLDLSAVSFMDAAGASFLVRAVERARGEGRAIALVRPSSVARRALEESGLHASELLANDAEAQAHALIATDLQGRVTDWNGGARDLYGWLPWEAVGRPITTVAVCPQDEALAAQISRTVSRDGIWDGEFDVVHRNGRTISARVRETLIRDGLGRPIGLLRLSVPA